MNTERLIKHVKLCRKNLRSDRVVCCAACPFEEEIARAFPDTAQLFRDKREKVAARS